MSRFICKMARALMILCASAFLLEIILACAGIPRWLMTIDQTELRDSPRYVVVLGGGGIPSESGLIRTYYAAKIGTNLLGANFIVSLPCVGDPETNSVGRMRNELVMRGLRKESILMEHEGLDTHQQAVNIGRMLGPAALHDPMFLVTSPYHLRRALACFRKQGFTEIAGVPAFGIGAEADMSSAGPVGLRYAFWANLQAEIEIAREYCALAYYRFRGWI